MARSNQPKAAAQRRTRKSTMYDIMEDRRIKCTSIMTSMLSKDYLALVDRVYNNKGGIEGQRAPLKTKTAITIRNRLVDDLQKGAIIPPIVVGVLVSQEGRAELAKCSSAEQLVEFLSTLDDDDLSIIDGMQRTTALKEAVSENKKVLMGEVRVEFWITEYINSLIYRMLVLNTGQVPWELARQLETVYGQFLRRISSVLGKDEVTIFLKEDRRRRADAAQYQGSIIVELLLVFSSRKTEVEVRDRVAEDFARLDAIETSAHSEFIDFFIEMLRCLARLDKAFSRLESQTAETPARFDAGQDIFGSLPAMAGFAAAVAVYLFDEPGFPIEWNLVPKKMETVKVAVDTLAKKIEKLKPKQLLEFMQLDLLQERLSGRRGGVGRHERELFKRAFNTMIRHAARLESLEPCWRAS
jgi:hypothetical protein